MTREFLVTCSASKCHADGRSKYVNVLPPGWLIVNDSYDGNPLEFCSWACVVAHGAAMQKAHESQREWQSRPLPVKPIDQPVPDGALL